MQRVFIIGGGKTCQIILDRLLSSSNVSIIGMAADHPSGSAVKTARKAGVPVWFTDPLEMLKQLDLDIVFSLTNDPKLTDRLRTLSETMGFKIVTNDITHLFLNTFVEPDGDENVLLRKHLKLSLMIAQSRTLEQVAGAIVTGGLEITRMPMGSLAIFNKNDQTFTLLSQQGLPVESRPHDVDSLLGGLAKSLLAGGKPLLIPDIQKASLPESAVLSKAGIRSLIILPLVSDKELLGILYFNDVQTRTYSAVLVDFLCQFAVEAVLAIQKHQAIAQVRHLSSRDALTDLYNRNQLILQLREAVLSTERKNSVLGLFLCDLDRFKEINETRGHAFGDRVLKLTAQRIKAVLAEEPREGNPGPPLLYRSGSDEIAVILPDTTSETVLQKAGLIRSAVQDAGLKVNCRLDISIGAALYPQHSQSSDQLIIVASQALQIAKKEDRRICMGAVETHYDTHRVGMIFEPIVHVDQSRVIGYEALGRDTHQEMSILDIFKKYEERGRLQELKNACFLAQLKKASELGIAQIFLNVDSTLLNQCEWVIKPADCSVVLEISESEPLHDVEAYLAITRRWKKKGFQFAIDDFGAGFISLPFISKLAPDYIKIDRSVILQAVASRSFRRFFKRLVASIQDARTPRIIAEGIETETELQVISDADIHFAQGYLFKARETAMTAITKDLHRV